MHLASRPLRQLVYHIASIGAFEIVFARSEDMDAGHLQRKVFGPFRTAELFPWAVGLHPLILFDARTPISYNRRDAFRDVSQSVAEELLGRMRSSLAFGLNVWAAIINDRTSSKHSNSLIMDQNYL